MTTPVASALESRLLSQKRFRPPKRISSGEVPRKFEREYISKMQFFVNTAAEVINQLLVPRLEELQIASGQTLDSKLWQPSFELSQSCQRYDESWDELLARIMVVARGSFEDLTGRERVSTPEEMTAKVTPSQKEATIKQFKQLLGVDLFLADDNISKIVKPFITENVGLIKTIGDEYFNQIESIVLRDFRAGQRAEQVAASIMERTGVASSRAKLIGRDQMNKLWGDLNRHRQTQAGVNRYTWRTSMDERVRPSHAMLEGKVFSWNRPPAVGHPGQPIQCRCWAEPMIDDVLADLEGQLGEPGQIQKKKRSSAESKPSDFQIRKAEEAVNKASAAAKRYLTAEKKARAAENRLFAAERKLAELRSKSKSD